ncbi:hypothetical protein NS228_23630 [Methylobacterium indicum]|uniref:hypothetical protein n=1 Tax=Methylobacterium indicum TaxID=1775910 RepID=UPI00073440AC|nr:hypothetical protein [Methylobacterium indicum]KTS23240.1 hypothetical protein NS229_22590 [Methylobacterium indicum]KTS30793.1 hypothetical protein NS228_23630 [Methylobacterium indicum]KTS50062.1 hypothetical protein NS230_16405 [Methylobacterium indicum]
MTPDASRPDDTPRRGLGHLPFAAVVMLAAAPNLLFLATHLANRPLAVGACACVAAALALVLRDLGRVRAPLDGPLLLVCLATALVLCLLGGQAHLFFANDDWLIRDAVLHDLVAEPWPVGYLYAGDATMLRAPLGLYLLPAAIGKLVGLAGAHAALLAQDTILFGCLFYGFARLAPSRRRGLALLAVFVVFSGWDIVGSMIVDDPLIPGRHLEQWLGSLQFSSHVTQLFWVPNHAASGWVFVGAYGLWRSCALRATSLAVVFGLCVFWSPLSMMGALPFLAAALVADLSARRLTLAGLTALACAGLGLVPVALYLGADATRVPHGLQELTGTFAGRYVLLIALELLPFLLILRLSPSAGDRWTRRETGLVAGLLLAVPLYRLGGADFVMRASIPALALLALRVGAAVPDLHGPRRIIAVAILGFGAVTPVYEVIRALRVPAFAVSSCSLLAAARTPPNDGPLFHYVARIDALRGQPADRVLAKPEALVRRVPQAMCWPDHPAHQEHAGTIF